MTERQMTFDLGVGLARKEAGMELAANNRSDLLGLCRSIAEKAARSRVSREACADDVYRGLIEMGVPTEQVGNMAGSFFKEKKWTFVRSIPSERASNNAREIKVWRLADGC